MMEPVTCKDCGVMYFVVKFEEGFTQCDCGSRNIEEGHKFQDVHFH